MTVSLKHTKTSSVADSGDTTLVQPSDWNAEHALTMATGKLLGRSTAGTGSAEEISVGGSLALSSGSLATSFNAQSFTAAGTSTWTKPSGATFVMVEVWASGGGGGGGAKGATSTARSGGHGGGGGAYTSRLFFASELPPTVSVTVGAGGTAGLGATVDSGNGGSGGNGATSSFGNFLLAYGGYGSGVSGANPGPGGGALSAATSTLGGEPYVSSAPSHFGGGTPSSGTSYPVGHGGAGGGYSSSTANAYSGNSSYQGGCGGGGGGGISSGNSALFPGGGGLWYTSSSQGTSVSLAGHFRSGGNGGYGVQITSFSITSNPSTFVYANSTFVLAYSFFIFTSSNGTTWTASPNPVTSSSNLNGPFIEWDGAQWVMIDDVGNVFTSTNLTAWTRRQGIWPRLVSTTNVINRFRVLNGKYYAITSAGEIYVSSDLNSWSRVGLHTASLTDITWNGTYFYACGTNGILRSSDGTTWVTVNSITRAWSMIVAGSSGRVVATAPLAQGSYYSDDNGANFSNTSIATGSSSRVYLLNGNFVILSASNLYTSSDGVTFTQQADGTAQNFYQAAYVSGTYYVPYTGGILTSSDLVTWTANSITPTASTAACPGGPGGIASGGGGGGAGLNATFNGGNGGKGGDGMVRVFTW